MEKRKSVRLMSSLMDLKLHLTNKVSDPKPVEPKHEHMPLRTNKKIMTIKGPFEDSTIY